MVDWSAVVGISIVVGALLLHLLLLVKVLQARGKQIPGPMNRDRERGHLDAVEEAGSLHQYLIKLHADYGPIAVFKMGANAVVSLASPRLFRQHLQVYGRQYNFTQLLEAFLVGDGEESRERGKLYDPCFTTAALSRRIPQINKCAGDLVAEWSGLSDSDHISLQKAMYKLSIKAVLATSTGKHLTNDKHMRNLTQDFDLVWSELESRVAGDCPLPGTERRTLFDEAKERIWRQVKEIVEDRRRCKPAIKDKLFVDILTQSDLEDKIMTSDLLGFLIGGFHTMANWLTWAFYHLGQNQDVQEKMYEEISSILGDDAPTAESIAQLDYTQQVVKEILRVSLVLPCTSHCSGEEMKLGGYDIPRNTRVVQAFGVVMRDPEIWPDPERFDPCRFSPENVKTRPHFSNQLFGFLAKSSEYGLSYMQAVVVLASVTRKFKVTRVSEEDSKPIYGLTTKPEDEIWISVEKRT